MSELQQQIEDSLVRSAKKVLVIDKTPFRTFHYTGEDLSHHIQRMGTLFERHKIKKGDRILIWGPNCAEWCVALLGCLRRAVVAVPVDIRHPKETVERIAKHSGATLVLCPQHYPSVGLPRVHLQDLLALLEDLPAPGRATRVDDGTLAEIVYTSGTTGVPKGVKISHGNLAANIRQCKDRFDLTDGQLVLCVLPLSHLFGQMGGLLFPIASGIRVLTLSVLKPSALREAFKEHPVTHFPAVPRLIDGLGRRLPFPKWLSSRFFFGKDLQAIIAGGAPLSAPTERLFRRLGYGPYVGYGLTETSPVLTINAPGDRKFQTAGRAVSDTRIKLAKDGEILVKGPQVFSGYYQNKEKTSESFADGWFCTGDLGSLDDDGFLTVKGRKKDVIVTPAGVNVYPDDIEHLLDQQRGVRASCVIGTGTEGSQIHAALCLDQGASAEQIVREVNRHLDAASHITSWSEWSEPDFPRTPTGKIRKFLVKQRLGTAEKATTQAQDRLSTTLATYTNKPITDEATMEQLGLSSIDRIELVSDLEQQYHLEIDEDHLTADLTVKRLRELVRDPPRIHHPTRWQASRPVSLLRRVLRPLLFLALERPFVDLQVEGLHHLADLDEPSIFIANHQSHYDGPSIFWTLPSRFSSRLCPAAWKEYFDSPSPLRRTGLLVVRFLAKLTHGIFLISQSGGALKALRHAGWLLDHHHHILFFPEGERSSTGAIGRFKPGIGLLVKNTRAPVVPIHIEGLNDILPRTTFWPRRGKARIVIGEPLRFGTQTPAQITEELEQAVKNLSWTTKDSPR